MLYKILGFRCTAGFVLSQHGPEAKNLKKRGEKNQKIKKKTAPVPYFQRIRSCFFRTWGHFWNWRKHFFFHNIIGCRKCKKKHFLLLFAHLKLCWNNWKKERFTFVMTDFYCQWTNRCWSRYDALLPIYGGGVDPVCWHNYNLMPKIRRLDKALPLNMKKLHSE